MPMDPFALSVVGGSGPHQNMPPALVLNFCIALQGVFPQRP
jgi:microcystin-dependent protein